MTSAAQRNLRNTKRDVEAMHQILLRKKRAQIIARAAERLSSGADTGRDGLNTGDRAATTTAPTAAALAAAVAEQGKTLLSKKPKERPSTPDLTCDENGDPVVDNQDFVAALLMIQKLIRGRAVQNIMFEGRFRRRELILELRTADEYLAANPDKKTPLEKEVHDKIQRDIHVRETSLDSMAGTVTSHMFLNMANQQVYTMAIISCLLFCLHLYLVLPLWLVRNGLRS
jgi:hypothetical protein